MSNNNKKPTRALHVVYNLGSGGIETWLLQILKKMDRDKVAIDILTPYPDKDLLDDQILATGAKILRCTNYKNPLRFARDFNKIVTENGPYDIIHSHVYALSGLMLCLGYKAGIPVRIAHSHNTAPITLKNRGLVKGIAYKFFKGMIPKYMTHAIAVSCAAGDYLFPPSWQTDNRYSILPCGIDLSRFEQNIDSSAVRREFNIPEDALVIGHVGRFSKQKNHEFIIQIFSELAKQEPKAHLLLVGKGELQDQIRNEVNQAGLQDKVHFVGARNDVPRIMIGAMDVFLFPSFFEGLPCVLNEAQAAGLPCVFSDNIAKEINVVEPLINRVKLTQPIHQWANTTLGIVQKNRPITQKKSLQIMNNSPVNIENNIKELIELYDAITAILVC